MGRKNRGFKQANGHKETRSDDTEGRRGEKIESPENSLQVSQRNTEEPNCEYIDLEMKKQISDALEVETYYDLGSKQDIHLNLTDLVRISTRKNMKKSTKKTPTLKQSYIEKNSEWVIVSKEMIGTDEETSDLNNEGESRSSTKIRSDHGNNNDEEQAWDKSWIWEESIEENMFTKGNKNDFVLVASSES